MLHTDGAGKCQLLVGADTVLLIQGDVGSGKTVVAFLALLTAAANGYQGAIMAPTEVLAAQHFEGFKELIDKYGLTSIKPVLLTGALSAKDKREAQRMIKEGEVNCQPFKVATLQATL